MSWNEIKSLKCTGDCGWQQTLHRINELRADGFHEFADDFLVDLALWIEKAKHVTDRQKEAIENISNAEDHDDWDIGSSGFYKDE